METPILARTYIREPLRTLSLGCNTEAQCIRALFCESAIRRFRAGTTPFSPLSARRKRPTLPRGAAGARGVHDDGTRRRYVHNDHCCCCLCRLLRCGLTVVGVTLFWR
jgi:hypothetical protein